MSPLANPDEPLLIFSSLATLAAAKYVFGQIARWNRNRSFQQVGRVASIYYYPIKSCGGVDVKTAECSKLGVKVDGVTDRHWVAITPDGNFLTQRKEPKMALIKASSHGDELFIEAPGMPVLKVLRNPQFVKSDVVACRVWHDDTVGTDCGQEASDWLSQFLNVKGVRLLFSNHQLEKRDASKVAKSWGNPALPGDQAAYSDFCSYMISSKASLKHLNTQIDSPVSDTNFRPNLVIDNDSPWDEDNWQMVRIGDRVTFRMLDGCTRCKMTTVNSLTGKMESSGEPLKTLKRIRCFEKYGSSPLFGVNAAIDVTGTVSVGDPVFALRKA